MSRSNAIYFMYLFGLLKSIFRSIVRSDIQ